MVVLSDDGGKDESGENGTSKVVYILKKGFNTQS